MDAETCVSYNETPCTYITYSMGLIKVNNHGIAEDVHSPLLAVYNLFELFLG